MTVTAEDTLGLPRAFCARMERLLGEEYGAFLASYACEAQKGLRFNPCKGDGRLGMDEFFEKSAFPLRKTEFAKDGFYFDCTESGIGATPEHHAGIIYVQEPAAMLPAAAAGMYLSKGDHVLDVCAAPGGKSAQFAAAVGAEGLLVSNEYVPARAKILLSNIERLGIPNAVVTNTDAQTLGKRYPQAFDCVAVDAPCSGEGMFRKNPLAVSEWSEENVAMCACRSFDILSAAEECLRPGGLLMYSTCTFAPEENEELIARFLDAYPDYTVLPLPEKVRGVTSPGLRVPGCREDLSLSARCYPHITGGEGQFVCLLRKGGDAPRREISETLLTAPTKAEQKAVSALFADLFDGKDVPLVRRCGENLYAVPPQMRVPGVCFSCGVKIGKLRGERILPHHQLFSAYGHRMRRKWDFSPEDERISAYLHGDTVTLTEEENRCGDGFGCVTICGYPLGGAKNVGGVLKNHYPKGLRRNDR